MRTRVVVVAFVVSLVVGGCVEPGAPAVTLGDPLGDRMFSGSLRVVGDQAYWMEMVAPAIDEPASLRLHRAGAAGVETLDTLSGVAVEQGAPFVLTDGPELVWGLGSALLGCGTGRWLHAGAPPALLRPLDEVACRATPVALRDGALMMMTAAGTDGAPTTTLTRHALATDASEQVATLVDWPIEWPAVRGDEVVAVMTTLSRRDEGQLVQFTLTDPAAWRPVGATIADRGGIAITDTQIVVIDDGGAGAPARVLAYPRAGTGDEAATVIAVLPGPAHHPVWHDDALWMIPGDPRPTGGARAVSPALWRIELDGTRTEFALEAPLAELTSDPAGLIAAGYDAAGLLVVRRVVVP